MRNGLLLLAWLAFSGLAAEQVYLRNGTVVSGTILSQDSNAIVIKGLSGVITIPRSDISRIEESRTERKSAAVRLKDGSVLRGTIEDSDSSSVVLSTQAGLLTLRRSIIDSITDGGSFAGPGSSGGLRSGIRGGSWALSGPVRRNYRSGSGGTIFMETSLGESSFLGLESRFGRFLATDNQGGQLDLAMVHAVAGYEFWFADRLLLLSPRAGIGVAGIRSIVHRRDVEYFALDYFQQREDYLGLVLLHQDYRRPNLRMLALRHYLDKGDRVGYVLSDRSIFREENSGVGVSGMLGFLLAFHFRSGFFLGLEAFGAGVGEGGGGLPLGGVQAELGWRF
ncbi:MAG: hypothetical protein HS115_19575 [Spirochaetales bacterium]|nr:hypothetical protein [Spirochaetales bacterium]